MWFEKGKARAQRRLHRYKDLNTKQKMMKVLNRVMKKIHLTKYINSGERDPIAFYPKMFGKPFKGYYLSREEIDFVEKVIIEKGKNFKNYFYSSEYAPWAGKRKYEDMTGEQIQQYLSKFKKHCKV